MSIIYDHFAPVLYGFALKLAGTEDAASMVLEKTFVYIKCNKTVYDESKQSPLLWMIGIIRMIHFQFNLNINKKQNQSAEYYVDKNSGGAAESKKLNSESAIVMTISLEHKLIFDQVFCGRNLNDIAGSIGKNVIEVKKMLREAVNHYRKANKLK